MRHSIVELLAILIRCRMTSKQNLELARQVFPSHGFFGAKGKLRLSIPTEKSVDFVQIGIQSGADSFLNLYSIDFYDNLNKKLKFGEIVKSAILSSSFDANDSCDVLENLVEGKPIHSALERLPTLSIALTSTVELSRIEIGNRTGVYGKRAQHLVCNAWCKSEEVLHYLNSQDEALITRFEEITEKVGVLIPDEINTQNQVDLKSAKIESKIAQCLKSGEVEFSMDDILSMLPMYKEDPVVTENTLILMGQLIAKLVEENPVTDTNQLSEFQHILSSPKRIETAARYATDALNRLSGQQSELVFSKHTIGVSRLLAEKEKHIAAIKIVQNQLEYWSITSVVCYGTLLGAVRDGGFIPHDDDVDMLYFDDSDSQESMMENRNAIIDRFKSIGYRVWISGANFQVLPPGYDIGVDLFPCWTNNDKTCLMMEKYRYREIPTDILLPTASVDLYGEALPAPNGCARFLNERYGSDWQVSNPYFEWPWELCIPDEWPQRSLNRRLETNRTVLVAWGQHVGPGAESPPKNSPSLIKKALGQNYDAIELDIRLAHDDVFVLGHDDRIISQSGEQIVISEHSADTLAEFDLGDYQGERNTIITLESALHLLGDKIAHIDPRIPTNKIVDLRLLIDRLGFDPSKIIFCGYGDNNVRELSVHFPESVILYKYYCSHARIDEFVLQELVEKQVDGLMLYWPMHYEECEEFSAKLRQYNLQVLFYVHGSWPARGERDQSDLSLVKMATAQVDYVTTTASNTDYFKQLVSHSV